MNKIWILCVFVFVWPLRAQQSDFATVDFTLAKQNARANKGKDLYHLPLLVSDLTKGLSTDVERFKAIYLWVCQNISGDYDLMLENNRMRKRLRDNPEALKIWNNSFKKEVFNLLRKQNRTLCSGYSFLIDQMAELAGIECEIINGRGEENLKKSNLGTFSNHSWNAVKLDGKWYLCDATWSAGFTNVATYLFSFDYDNSYFLMAPEEFAKSHQPEQAKWTLLSVTNIKEQ